MQLSFLIELLQEQQQILGDVEVFTENAEFMTLTPMADGSISVREQGDAVILVIAD